MSNIQKILSERRLIRVAAVFVGILFFYLFPEMSSSIDIIIQNGFYSVAGEAAPDTNIVLIEITGEDTAKLDEWPMKLSYYALLIDKLNGLGVKRIGIEAFLPPDTSYQKDDYTLIENVLNRSGNVVLGSLLNSINFKDGHFITDSVIVNEQLTTNIRTVTGHLNYLKLDGVYVPAKVYKGDKTEGAFPVMLSGSQVPDGMFKVNFNTSFDSFEKYSLHEFFEGADLTEYKAKFNDKIVIIGISDPARAKTVKTHFDAYLPGLGLHAIALNNILTSSSLLYSFKSPSIYIFMGLVIVLALLPNGIRKKTAVGMFLLTSVICFVALQFFFTELAYAAFVIPFFIFLLTEAGIDIADREVPHKSPAQS